MRGLAQQIAKAAASNSTVLILGESGTGKELVARAIHRLSPRSSGSFVAVNCAALSENLIDSELFGHRRGAFTGAFTSRKGKFELAARGVLFLDEVGEMSLPIQAKLLRALQEREIDPIGSEQPIPVDIRVIGATNRDIDSMVDDGRFREDLYFRLSVIVLKIPPLRARREDIPELALHFAQKHGREQRRRTVRGVSPEAESVLTGQEWRGNVRQLENVIAGAVAMGESEYIQPDELPVHLMSRSSVEERRGLNYYEVLRAAQRDVIERAFDLAGCDYKRAALLLGLHYRSMHKLIHKLGMDHLLQN